MSLAQNNNTNIHDGNLANFAELLLMEDAKKGPVIPGAPSVEELPPESRLDVSKVVVPDDFVSIVIEGKVPTKLEAKVEAKQEVVNPTELINKFMNLIQEGKKLIQEMTTCGMLGSSLASKKPEKKVKKKKSVQEIVNSILQKKK